MLQSVLRRPAFTMSLGPSSFWSSSVRFRLPHPDVGGITILRNVYSPPKRLLHCETSTPLRNIYCPPKRLLSSETFTVLRNVYSPPKRLLPSETSTPFRNVYSLRNVYCLPKRLLPSETSITVCRTTRRNATKDPNVQQNPSEDLKFALQKFKSR